MESTERKLRNWYPSRGPAIERFLQELNDVPPAPCKFKKGDQVSFTNEYGLIFGPFKIIGFNREIDPEWRPDAFIYLDKSSYWFPVEADCLSLVDQQQNP